MNYIINIIKLKYLLKMDNYLIDIPIEMVEIVIAYLDEELLDTFIESKIIDITRLNWNRVYKNRFGCFSRENIYEDLYKLYLRHEDRDYDDCDYYDDYDNDDYYDDYQYGNCHDFD